MPEDNLNFDEAWAEANVGKKPEEDKQEEQRKDQPQDQDDELKKKDHQGADEHLAKDPDPEQSQETDDTDYKALYEKEVQRTKSWDGRLRKANQEAREARKAAEEAQAEVARLREENQSLRKAKSGSDDGASHVDPADSDDEKLKAFIDEFPDLHAPLQALIRKEAKALLGNENEDLKTKVKSLEESEAERQARQQEEATQAHFNTIRESHPDYEQYIEDGSLDEWIATKPLLMQDTLTRVKDKGTASEVVEMFDLMKSDLGVEKEESSPQNANEKPGDKQEKLKSMVAVPGSSAGPPPAAPDKNDFDSAWKEATK